MKEHKEYIEALKELRDVVEKNRRVQEENITVLREIIGKIELYIIGGGQSPEIAPKNELQKDFKDDLDAKCWCKKCGVTLIGEEGESLCENCAG